MGNPRLTDQGSAVTGIEAVGTTLSERREELNLSRTELAERLHMGEEQLQALEEGELSRLNEPVFIKAMVRRVASHLELDADHLVGQLSLLSNPSQKRSYQQSAGRQPSDASGSLIVKASIGLLALLGGTAIWIVLHPRFQDTPSTAQTITSPSVVKLPAAARVSTSHSAKLILESSEPSWIALRRNGTVFFEGNLSAPMEVQDPSAVEVYAGRPDQVMVRSGDKPPESLGGISDMRWYSLNPER